MISNGWIIVFLFLLISIVNEICVLVVMGSSGALAPARCSCVWFTFHACLKSLHKSLFGFFFSVRSGGFERTAVVVSGLCCLILPLVCQSINKALLYFFILKIQRLWHLFFFLLHKMQSCGPEGNHCIYVSLFIEGKRKSVEFQTKLLHLMWMLPECTKQVWFLKCIRCYIMSSLFTSRL